MGTGAEGRLLCCAAQCWKALHRRGFGKRVLAEPSPVHTFSTAEWAQACGVCPGVSQVLLLLASPTFHRVNEWTSVRQYSVPRGLYLSKSFR